MHDHRLRLDLDELKLDPEQERALLDELVALEQDIADELRRRGHAVPASYAEAQDLSGRHEWLDLVADALAECPDEDDLQQRWQDAADKRWTLALSGLDQVLFLLRRHRGRRVTVGDLRQEGVLGLYEAARRFDPARGLRFSTYARWWARASMAELVGRTEWAVRLPNGARQQLHQLGREDGEGKPLSSGQSLALQRVKDTVSLDAPQSADGRTWAEVIEADREGPEEQTERRRRLRQLRRARRSASLTERHRRVLRERFALDGSTRRSLASIGRDLGISGERVRQIQNQALRRLRGELRA